MKKLEIDSPNEGDSVMMSLFMPAAVTVIKELKFKSAWN